MLLESEGVGEGVQGGDTPRSSSRPRILSMLKDFFLAGSEMGGDTGASTW